MKRLISALLILTLCLTALPFAGVAQAATDGPFTYEIADGEVTITRCEYASYDHLVIPETIEGYPVTSIGNSAFYQCFLLSGITLPKTIRYIGEKAFFGCSQLKTIYFCGDAPEFAMSYGMCYDHAEDPWGDLDFDFSAEHEYGPFEGVSATVYFDGSASGWDAVTSWTMTGGGCYYNTPQGRITIQQMVPATLNGSLTAYGQGAVTLELTSNKTYSACQTLTEESYLFDNLIPGTYTLTLSQEGAVTRVYELTLTEGETVVNLKLHRPGDLNGDNRYDIGDVARIYAHAKGSKALTGYELLCAEFTGDGKITVGDTAKAYALLLGK